METNASYASNNSKDFQAPNFEHHPGVMTSAGFTQTPLSLQPPTIANTGSTVNSPAQQQQQAGNNTNTQRGQQKKTSRFLLEMPQLSMPRPRPITSTTPANPRAQVSITRPNIQQQQHTASSQAMAKTDQKRVTQLQMPSLHMPSKPKLPTTSAIHHTTKAPSSNQSHNTSLTVSKPSLQVSMPAQGVQSRPTIHQAMNKNATQTQAGSANAVLHMPQTQQQHVGPLSPEMVGNGVASQQDDASDSNTTATNTSQEMQAVEKSNASETPQDTPSVFSEGESLNSDHITEASRGVGSSVFSATDVQIQQPLQLTTPIQQATTTSASAVNANTTSVTVANTVEMADLPITTYSDPTFTSFNQAPQQMDTTSSASTNSSQDPTAAAGVYSMYGAEMYQQPNQQMQMV